MSTEFESIFTRLRSILKKHARTLRVTQNGPNHYCLEGPPGPATLKAWGGKMKKPTIPVAWVRTSKAYVSYHLMGVYGNAQLRNGMSQQLKARMQGKTCFNFNRNDEVLFKELEQLTAAGLAAFKESGYIAE